METTHPLRAFRESQIPPLSLDDLAAKLGVSKSYVSRWETGKRKIDGKYLKKINEITGIAPSVVRPDLAEIMAEAAE